MTVEAQVCPQCGATLQFSQDQAEGVCAHCGARVIRSTASTSVEKELADEQLVQETIAREKRLHDHGRPATGTIVSAQATAIFRQTIQGRAVLMAFTVEVQPDGAPPFSAKTMALVALKAVDKYQAGTVLDLRYDPADHAQVAVEGRHGVPESNPEEQARQQQAREAAEQLPDPVWPAPPAAEALTPAWGQPRAAGTVPVPAQFDSVTNLGAARAVYRHEGSLLPAILSGPKPKVLVLYQDGLAFHKGDKQLHIWRWPELAAILTDMHFVPARRHGSSYTTHEYTLLTDSGEKLILDDGLGFAEVEQLIEPIKAAVYALLYPPLQQRYGAGQPVVFGPLTVHRANGLALGGKTYAWADIIEVKVDDGRLSVTLRDEQKHAVRTSGIPNVELLCRLIGVELAPSQLWAI